MFFCIADDRRAATLSRMRKVFFLVLLAAATAQTPSTSKQTVTTRLGCTVTAKNVGERHNEKHWGAEENAVAQAERTFCADSLQRGAAAWEAASAPDVAIPRAGKVLVGPGSVREFYEQAYKQGLKLSWKPTFVQVIGDVALSSGPYEGSVEGKDGRRSFSGAFFSVWRRQKDGSWKLQWDGGTPRPQK